MRRMTDRVYLPTSVCFVSLSIIALLTPFRITGPLNRGVLGSCRMIYQMATITIVIEFATRFACGPEIHLSSDVPDTLDRRKMLTGTSIVATFHFIYASSIACMFFDRVSRHGMRYILADAWEFALIHTVESVVLVCFLTEGVSLRSASFIF